MNTKKYQLPKEFGEKWVKALRSGEYKRGKGAYYNKETDCYCGLGVSIVVAGCEPHEELFFTNGYHWPITDDVNYGLKEDIVHLNDHLNYTFEQQADWICENVNFI